MPLIFGIMPNNQIDALLPRIRQAVLARLLIEPSRNWYLSELAESIGLIGPDIRRELSQLAKADIIKEWRNGNRVYFSANQDCPFFPELRGLLLKTAGLVDLLKDALKPLTKDIELAFVYGSIARSDEHSASDIDLMVIGAIDPMEISKRLNKAERTLRREISPSVYQAKGFRDKVRGKNHFLISVLEGAKLFVIGSEQDLIRIVE